MPESDNKNPRLLTTKEVSEYLRIPVSSLWSLTRKGKIRGVKVGKHWRYLESEIQAFLAGSNGHSKISDNRRHCRINCEIPAKLTILLSGKDEFPIEGLIRNLSEGGALLVYEGPLAEVGDPVKIVFAIEGNHSPKFELFGRVVHKSSNSKAEAGIKFRGISSNDREVIRDYVG